MNVTDFCELIDHGQVEWRKRRNRKDLHPGSELQAKTLPDERRMLRVQPARKGQRAIRDMTRPDLRMDVTLAALPPTPLARPRPRRPLAPAHHTIRAVRP